MAWAKREELMTYEGKAISSDSISKADLAMALVDRGLCPDCGGPMDEDGMCRKAWEAE